MPPRVPVCLARASGLSARCAFSTSAPTQALGPQSPNYIDVPKPRQPTFPLTPDSKGHLPIPRDIFKTRNPQPKQSPQFLARTTRDAKDRKQPGPHSRDADLRLYKQRLTEVRKESLREGVKELHARKVAADAAHLAHIQQSGAERTKLAMAPRREVDVLTETSTDPGVRGFLAGTLPAEKKNMKSRRRAFNRKMAGHQAVREARLHSLYTNARHFIVNEEQLDEAIEKTFGTEEAPIGWDIKGNMGLRTEGKEGLSPWNGPMPEGVGDLLHKLRGGEGVGLAKERVKKLAEELTGGKM
jgi:hypothetical protein